MLRLVSHVRSKISPDDTVPDPLILQRGTDKGRDSGASVSSWYRRERSGPCSHDTILPLPRAPMASHAPRCLCAVPLRSRVSVHARVRTHGGSRRGGAASSQQLRRDFGASPIARVSPCSSRSEMLCRLALSAPCQRTPCAQIAQPPSPSQTYPAPPCSSQSHLCAGSDHSSAVAARVHTVATTLLAGMGGSGERTTFHVGRHVAQLDDVLGRVHDCSSASASRVRCASRLGHLQRSSAEGAWQSAGCARWAVQRGARAGGGGEVVAEMRCPIRPARAPSAARISSRGAGKRGRAILACERARGEEAGPLSAVCGNRPPGGPNPHSAAPPPGTAPLRIPDLFTRRRERRPRRALPARAC